MSMSSERPQTPPASEYGQTAPPAPSNSTSSADSSKNLQSDPASFSDGYVPRLLDLIYPLPDASKKLESDVPSQYLGTEAVDSARLLGHGASFTASLQRVPKGPQRIEITTMLDGLTMTQSSPAPPRPEFVVYKVARIHFAANGEALPQHRNSLQSVLTEIHALTYPPLLRHPNIINFLGFAWGSNPFSPSYRLPAVVVEFARHGTLADVLRRGLPESGIRRELCLDVARGISAVHEAGLVHGDVKAENVLLCQGPGRKYIAKIADFGFSIIEVMGSHEVSMGGTRPWKAPETRHPVPLRYLRATDIYSLGLLIWYVIVAMNPFDLLLDATVSGPNRDQEIENLKQDGKILVKAHEKFWLKKFIERTVGQKLELLLDRILTGKILTAVREENATDKASVLPKLRTYFVERLVAHMSRQELFRGIDEILDLTICSDPERRNIGPVIILLETVMTSKARFDEVLEKEILLQILASKDSRELNLSLNQKVDSASIDNENETRNNSQGPATEEFGETVPNSRKISIDDATRESRANEPIPEPESPAAGESEIPSPASHPPETEPASSAIDISIFAESLSWSRRGYNRHWMSWQKTRELEPSVQNLVFNSFPRHDGPELFVLAGLYMNGYGCEADSAKALECIQKSVELDGHVARANMHRIFSAISNVDGDQNPGSRYLSDYAIIGSRTALEELWSSGQLAKYKDAAEWLGDSRGGVGAYWFYSSNMLHGLTQAHWMKDAFTLEKIKDIQNLSEYVINKKGDTILHFVASCGRWKPLKSLISDYKMDINLRNHLGETPLLCACRSGGGAVAIICLQTFKADASIAANNGETPLHWVSSFANPYIEPLTNDLFANGAKIDAMTNERIRHSGYPGTVDIDFKLPGTPLDWAVHNNRPDIVKVLLQHGANANGLPEQQKVGGTPVAQAAYYHYDECLKVMIDHLENKGIDEAADGNFDPRKVVMYGPLVRNAVHASDKFSMILRHGKQHLLRLHSTLDFLREKTKLINFSTQVSGSLLYFAVSELHDEAVEYMFQHDWLVEDLDPPCGNDRRTPLLEAVRWNRKPIYRMLREHGANIHALAANPFKSDRVNWTALHIFAYEGHNQEFSIVEDLIIDGFPVDGPLDSPNLKAEDLKMSQSVPDKTYLSTDKGPDSETSGTKPKAPTPPCETPLAVSLRHNAFKLSTVFLEHGANPNALVQSSGLFETTHPTTILGQTVISNARYSSARLRFILAIPSVSFLVEPQRKLSALHRCALAYFQVRRTADGTQVQREEWDFDTNADIMHELLLKYRTEKHLNARSRLKGNTALHLAITVLNVRAVEALVRAGADTDTVMNAAGETARGLAESLKGEGGLDASVVEEIVRLVR